MSIKCNSCGAVYDPIDGSGYRFFHVCPVERIVTPAKFNADGSVKTPAITEPFPNPRNENVVLDRETHESTIISEGLGVTEIPKGKP
jgi:hypothetical protein